ncbi:lytic transglycosylase domain-containing protein [Nocardia sp. NPDC058658]|uniref:lytic transglycosylase domain-containing protein n=1 Tax=Nocardia sp. NPDC058658 TaxID=3346580 RepID=UPI00365D63FC
MRISAPITMSALVVAGLVASGSAVHTSNPSTAPTAPEALLAANASTTDDTPEADPSEIVGLLPVAQEAPRRLRALNANAATPFAGTVPLQTISLPTGSGALGIPEIVLAAYRNAELALESAQPGCGLTWNLLAGIGRIESGHASSGRTDPAGTTTTPIFGPALDGTLPGNEVIKAADGGFVRAMGPMQFLPSTWVHYAADGNGDGASDPHNVFDAALAAGKYLCSGGMNLRETAQELRAVLRYNNSMSYAANVLSWSAAYRTGGAPSQVAISPNIIPPGSAPTAPAPNVLAASTNTPTTTTPAPTTPKVTTPTQVMIHLPGLPPIPCGILCPAPVAPPETCVSEPLPAEMPNPLEPGQPVDKPAAQTYGAAAPKDPAAPEQPVVEPAACTPAAVAPAEPAPVTPEKTPEPGVAATEEPAPAEPAPAAPVAPPAITLPFGIVIPLPPAPAPAP